MQYQRTNLERNLRMQLTAAMDNIRASIKQVVSSKEGVRQAEKAYLIMQKKFEVGAATVIELDDANLLWPPRAFPIIRPYTTISQLSPISNRFREISISTGIKSMTKNRLYFQWKKQYHI